jgi:DNA-binding NarL/FixJ family response regulator
VSDSIRKLSVATRPVGGAALSSDSLALTVLVLGGRPFENAGLRSLVSEGGSIVAIAPPMSGETRAAADLACPDVVLLAVDSEMNRAEDAIDAARTEWKPAPVLVVASDWDQSTAFAFVRAGARGVIEMDASAAELAKAIHKIRDGEFWLERAALSRLIDELAANARGPNPIAARLEQLTRRERQVIDHVAQGLSNKAIARRLGISDNTVRHHLTTIFAKLGVTDRLALAVHASRAA